MAFLYHIKGQGSPPGRWEFNDKPMVVGRGEFADAQVQDETLSNSHFLIVREGADFFLVDLDSRNGTWVNGERVSGHKLHPNEVIMAGQSLFYFSHSPVPPDTVRA